MRIVDFPQKYHEDAYHQAIGKQVDELSKISGVKSIYQIGGISTPGISDIDLVVVFEDGFKYNFNPKLNNDNIGNYLFTHGLYGASETYFKESLKYTFFHNFNLLYGDEFDLNNTTSESNQVILKKQIALEFLFKMYINLVVQKSYNTIKLRSLFLHIKALPYDFEFLNIHPESLLNIIEKGISLRNNWFSGNVSKSDIKNWFKNFFEEFELFLNTLFRDYSLYANYSNFKIAPNIEIRNSNSLEYIRTGVCIPNLFNVFDKKYFKLLNRMNDFVINVPLTIDSPKIVEDYFKYAQKTSEYNKKYIPHFMTLTTSLKVYR